MRFSFVSVGTLCSPANVCSLLVDFDPIFRIGGLTTWQDQANAIGSATGRHCCYRNVLGSSSVWQWTFANLSNLSPHLFAGGMWGADGGCFVNCDKNSVRWLGKPANLLELPTMRSRTKMPISTFLHWPQVSRLALAQMQSEVTAQAELLEHVLGAVGTNFGYQPP